MGCFGLFFAAAGSLLSGAGMCARRRTHFLLLRQKKVSKEKATRLSATPSPAASGATCAGQGAECAVELTARFALRSNIHGESDHDAGASCGAPAHSTPCPPQAHTHGSGEPHGPSLRSAWSAARSARVAGRAQRWPESGGWVPFCMRRGAQRAGWPVCRRTHRLRHLTCRSCLNGARQRAVSSAAHPAREHRRLPRSAAKGSQTAGSPFLCLLSFGETKESECAAGRITRLRETTPPLPLKQLAIKRIAATAQ